MMTHSLRSTLALLVTVFGMAHSPSSWAQTSFQSWMAAFNHIQLGPDSPWSFYLELQTRLNQTPETARGNRILVRSALRYKLCPEWALTVGHGWTPNLAPFRNENRLWEQAQYTWKKERWLLSSRTRLEQRWVEPRGAGANPGLAHRVREMIRVQYWPWELNPTENTNDVSLAFWDEFFLTPDGYDQNRIFAGLNIGMSSKHRLEVGYMYLHLRSMNSAQPDLRGHTLGLFLFSEY